MLEYVLTAENLKLFILHWDSPTWLDVPFALASLSGAYAAVVSGSSTV